MTTLEDKVETNYNDKQYITSYYTIHDTLYDMDSSMNEQEDFTFNADHGTEALIAETESGSKKYKLNPANLFDSLSTYYTTAPSIIVDVTPEGIVSFRNNNSNPAPTLYSQICRLEADTEYDSKKHYYRVVSTSPSVNYTIKGNIIVFNNMHSSTTLTPPMEISVYYTKYTRKHDKDKTYFHGAEDGLFMHENKKRSVANAMNEDIKVMIRQNEQMMVLGGITLATLVVGAYVILRN